jgi:hypothetical protein
MICKVKKIFICLFLSVLAISVLSAQATDKKRYKATQIKEAPAIDGILNDEAWKTGEWTDDFTQFEPYNGRKPSQKTEFKIVYDNNNLYVGVKAYDSSPDSIVNRLTRRDHEDGDMVAIIFDSFHDLRTGFYFGVSAGGVKFDQMIVNDGQNMEDMTWDPNWWVATAINSEGWVAEMKIPFSQLRFEKSEEVWGLEMLRTIYRKQETNLWQHIPQDAPGIIHMIGEMSGIENVKPRKIFDVTPYGVAQTERYASEEGNPFSTGKRSKLNGGLDAKIGVTNNLTMDLTINPDFGQVEADPSEVNLTAYETYFQEKRPFFIEGNNIVSFGLGVGDGEEGNDNLFYSRRIGRRPQIEPGEDYDYEGKPLFYQAPDRTSILGAAKLTGKTKDGLSIGFMNAVTSEEIADIDTGGYRTTQVVEPLTNYLAARLQKDYKEGNTIIGGMVTAVNRFMDDIPASEDPVNTLKNTLSNAAYTGGLDFTQYFHKKTYMINLNTAFSYIEGTELAMVKAQESSARYFQKPGNSIPLDSSRTSLVGNGGRLQFMKAGNGHWNYGGAFVWKTPGLELNDMGYMREADQMLQAAWVNYRLWEPKSFYRNINLNATQYAGWDFSGIHLFDGVNAGGNVNFKNYWSTYLGTNLNYNSISNSMLRGGPVMKMPGSLNSWLHINTDSRKKIQLELAIQHSLGFEGSHQSLDLMPEIIYKPVNALSLTLIPSYKISKDELQYVDQQYFEDQPRYIFGTIDQKVYGMSFRVNFNFTPDLTLQYWGQPFIASGKYYDYKYIADPMTTEYHDRFILYTPEQISYNEAGDVYEIREDANSSVDYAFGKPDFNVREFLSNFVLRWEYNPGSSVYLVWSQTRFNDEYSGGTMDYSGDMNTLFNLRPHNVFLIKFSYRFGLR